MATAGIRTALRLARLAPPVFSKRTYAVQKKGKAAIAERRALNERRNLIDKAKEKQALTIGKTMKAQTLKEIKAKMEGKNLLQFLHEEAVLDMGMMNRRNWLRKNSRDCLKPGYAIEVTAITSKTLRKRYTYVGTIIAIRRRGLQSSFSLRNTVQGVGYTVSFPIYSPLIVGMRVLDTSLKVRRNKLYYMERNPDKNVIIAEDSGTQNKIVDLNASKKKAAASKAKKAPKPVSVTGLKKLAKPAKPAEPSTLAEAKTASGKAAASGKHQKPVVAKQTTPEKSS